MVRFPLVEAKKDKWTGEDVKRRMRSFSDKLGDVHPELIIKADIRAFRPEDNMRDNQYSEINEKEKELGESPK